jgi:hypothetical protein
MEVVQWLTAVLLMYLLMWLLKEMYLLYLAEVVVEFMQEVEAEEEL